MTIFKIVLNGKLTKKDLPDHWDKTSFGQFLELAKVKNDRIKAVSIFTGVDYDIIRKAKIQGIETVIHSLSFLDKEIVPKVPQKLLWYDMPKDLGFETFAQYHDLKEDIHKIKGLTEMEQLAKFPLYCAVFACTQMSKERCAELAKQYPNEGIVYGEYHWRKAEAMQEEFLNAPATEVLGVGNFTLLKLIGLNLNINPNSRKPLTRMRRLMLVLKRWLLRSGLLQPLITLRVKWQLARMKY